MANEEAGALDGEIASCEASRRWSDVIRLLEKRAAVATSPAERAGFLGRAAQMSADKLANSVEAMRLGELAIADGIAEPATVELLRGIYQKRRDRARLAKLEELVKGG